MSPPARKPRLAVVGACNIDLISYVPRMPELGETLHGTRFHMGFGGKGANQAAMAAKLGADVGMVTKLGRDVFGGNTLENLRSLGIRTDHVHFTEEAFSGVAPIAVDPEGGNSIIIVTGANDLLTDEEIEAARGDIAQSDALICQLEIPLAPNLQALRIARAAGVRTILNPAPARADLPEEAYALSDIFCPNESEAQLLTGIPSDTPEQSEQAARELLKRGAKTAILTLGARGCLVATESGVERIPAQKVDAVDSTGAGDAFVGSLGYLLAQGRGLADAARVAGQIASRSVLKSGTQTSFPSREEVRDLLEAR